MLLNRLNKRWQSRGRINIRKPLLISLMNGSTTPPLNRGLGRVILFTFNVELCNSHKITTNTAFVAISLFSWIQSVNIQLTRISRYHTKSIWLVQQKHILLVRCCSLIAESFKENIANLVEISHILNHLNRWNSQLGPLGSRRCVEEVYLTTTSWRVAVRFKIRYLRDFVLCFTTTKTIIYITSTNSGVGWVTYTATDTCHSFCVWHNSLRAERYCVWEAIDLVVGMHVKMIHVF